MADSMPHAAPDGQSDPENSQSINAQILAAMLRETSIWAIRHQQDPHIVMAENLLTSAWLREQERAAAEEAWDEGAYAAGYDTCSPEDNPYRRGDAR